MKADGEALGPRREQSWSETFWREVPIMGTNNEPNKNTALALNQKAIQGVDKYFAKVKNLTIAGTSYTPAALKAVLQAETDANEALDTSRAQMKQQVAAGRAARAKASAARKGLRAYILGTAGASAVQMLGDFGMVAPKSTGTKTAQVKAEAATKATATREARDASKKLVVSASPTAAPAATPAHVVQASPPVQTAAPAATSAPQQ
jgi:hypothetical protein